MINTIDDRSPLK